MTQESIDQAAHNIHRKPGKLAARDIVRGLYAKARDDAERYELAQLYAYFRPALPKKPKTPWEWVAQAIGVNDAREYLQYVHVCAAWVTGPDGHRLHRYRNVEDLEPRFYDQLGALIHPADWRRYPDIDRLWKTIASAETVSTLEHVETEAHAPIGKIDCLTVEGVLLDLKYWQQAAAAPDLTLPHVMAYPEERGGTIQIDGSFPNGAEAQAIVMGMKP